MELIQLLTQKIETEAGLVALLLFVGILGMIALYKQARGDTKEARDKLDKQSDRTLDIMEKHYIILTRIEGKLK